jgi:LysM repeat protein
VGADKAEDENVKIPNSQNMALLQASVSPVGQATTSGGDIAIVGGTSLLSETTTATETKVVSPTSDQISLYVVHKGDTLSEIAKMYGVTKNTIVWANDLQGKSISVGQTLVILPISGVQHTVKKGDTLQSIAKLYKADLDEILQFNNLSKNSKIAIGDEIIIPDGDAIIQTPVKSKTGSTKQSSPYPVYEGYYMRPVVGGIKTQGVHGHNGVDLASSYGTNILASASGEVLIARSSGWNGGYGSYVVIKHSNGTQTLYGHLSSVSVSAGDTVEQGQIIGKMGSTGKSTGVHLHFEIRGARNPF